MRKNKPPKHRLPKRSFRQVRFRPTRTPVARSAAGVADKTGVLPGPEAGVVAGSGLNTAIISGVSGANPEGQHAVVAGQPAMLEEHLEVSVAALSPVAPVHEKEQASKAQTAKTIIPVQTDSATLALRSAAGVTDNTGVTPGPVAGVVAGSAGKLQPSPASQEQIRKNSSEAAVAGQPAMLEETLKGSSPAAPDLRNGSEAVVAGQLATLKRKSREPVEAPVRKKQRKSKAPTKHITPEGGVQVESASPATASATGMQDKTAVTPGPEAVVAGVSAAARPRLSPAAPDLQNGSEAVVAGQLATLKGKPKEPVEAPVKKKQRKLKAPTKHITPEGGVQVESASPATASATGMPDKTAVTPGPEAVVAGVSGAAPPQSSPAAPDLQNGSEAVVAGQLATLKAKPKELVEAPVQKKQRKSKAPTKHITPEGGVQVESASPATAYDRHAGQDRCDAWSRSCGGWSQRRRMAPIISGCTGPMQNGSEAVVARQQSSLKEKSKEPVEPLPPVAPVQKKQRRRRHPLKT